MAHSFRLNRTGDLLRVLPLVTMLGMITLALTIFLGFEEPNTPLLLLSSCLVLAAPIGVLTHLAFTRELTRDEKREWARSMMSAQFARALSGYISSSDRHTALDRLRIKEERDEHIDDV